MLVRCKGIQTYWGCDPGSWVAYYDSREAQEGSAEIQEPAHEPLIPSQEEERQAAEEQPGRSKEAGVPTYRGRNPD